MAARRTPRRSMKTRKNPLGLPWWLWLLGGWAAWKKLGKPALERLYAQAAAQVEAFVARHDLRGSLGTRSDDAALQLLAETVGSPTSDADVVAWFQARGLTLEQLQLLVGRLAADLEAAARRRPVAGLYGY